MDDVFPHLWQLEAYDTRRLWMPVQYPHFFRPSEYYWGHSQPWGSPRGTHATGYAHHVAVRICKVTPAPPGRRALPCRPACGWWWLFARRLPHPSCLRLTKIPTLPTCTHSYVRNTFPCTL